MDRREECGSIGSESSSIEVYFKVFGEVVGKGRPRFTTRGGFPRAVTPAKTRTYEERVRTEYIEECGVKWDRTVPLEMIVNAYFEVPKSASKKAKERMILHERPTKKPDWDNIGKAVSDALNEIAYGDDAQIVSATVNKFWASESAIEVTIREVRT